jgi:Domain of unknown function (DUF4350)
MKNFVAIVFLLAGAVFLWALIQLFEMRFARGDVYPAYSTLRSDPLGAKAFYDSLAAFRSLDVRRNEKALDRFSARPGTTLFAIGAAGLSASQREIENLEHFLNKGGRLVIAFYPQPRDTWLVERKEKKTASPSPSPSASPEEEEPTVKFLSTRDLARRWEFKLNTEAKLTDSAGERVAPFDVDPKISWHSALHFKGSAPVWKTVYASAEFPVVIERSIGRGTLVLASDSYFLSNEAMRRERHPALLAWLAGSNHSIVFDETHLGIRENPGISTLMRRYRLGGLLVGLALLGALAVWKNAARLIPAKESETEGDEMIAGRESFAGFVNLLRRNIAPSALLPICVSEWSKFLPRTGNKSKAQLDRATQISEESTRDVVAGYRKIAEELTTKWKPHRTSSSRR